MSRLVSCLDESGGSSSGLSQLCLVSTVSCLNCVSAQVCLALSPVVSVRQTSCGPPHILWTAKHLVHRPPLSSCARPYVRVCMCMCVCVCVLSRPSLPHTHTHTKTFLVRRGPLASRSTAKERNRIVSTRPCALSNFRSASLTRCRGGATGTLPVPHIPPRVRGRGVCWKRWGEEVCGGGGGRITNENSALVPRGVRRPRTRPTSPNTLTVTSSTHSHSATSRLI